MRTYLPFKIIRSTGKASRAIANRWDVVIAKIPPCKDSEGQHHAKEFSGFIVKACNLHDELLVALEGLLADISEYQTKNNLGGENNHWQVIARKLIKKAHDLPSRDSGVKE